MEERKVGSKGQVGKLARFVFQKKMKEREVLLGEERWEESRRPRLGLMARR